MSNAGFSNPDGKVFKIDDACPLCWFFFGVIGLFFSIAYFLFYDHTENAPLVMVGVVSIVFMSYGWINKNKNTSYIIDSRKNYFFIPLKDEPLCRLSDILNINKRKESKSVRESYVEKGKQKYRTVVKNTYYVQIIGEDIHAEFSFKSQGKRDHLYSSLNIGVKDVNSFIKTTGSRMATTGHGRRIGP